MTPEEISLIKSSTGITKLFSDSLVNSVLEANTEKLSTNPNSFVSLLFSGIGDLTANAFLQQSLIKKEMHKNTAILPKSLLRYLTSDELANIFATPSQSTFFIAFPYDALIKNAVVDPSTKGANIKKARINKDSNVLLLGKSLFILDHSINILILNSETDDPTINITYDTSDKYSDNFTVINNPYINNKIFTFNGIKYVGFEFIARSYTRSYQTFSLDLDTIKDKIIYYDNQLMGFEVLYKSSNSDNFVLLNGYPEGVDPIDGYNYSLGNKNSGNYIKINFGQSNTSFTPGTRSTITVRIYTTDGANSNLTFTKLDADLQNNIQFMLKQDITNPFEQCIMNMTPLITTRSTESTGGKDQMTFEELREFVISKSSTNKTITPADLERQAAKFNCSVEKIRHDVLYLIYKLNTTLKDNSNDYLSSGSGVFRFNLDDVPIRNEIKARILKPDFVYRSDDDGTVFSYQKDPITIKEYLKNYRNNKSPEACFPFFMKATFSDVIKTNVYNMSFDDTYWTDVDYYDNYALDTVSIGNVNLSRNPLLEHPTEQDIADGLEGMYTITFNATIGQNLYEQIKAYNPEAENSIAPLKFKLVIKSKEDSKTYYTDCTIVDRDDTTNTIKVKSVLITNNNINSDNQLCFTDYTLIPVPTPPIYESFYYIGFTADIQILVAFQSEEMFSYRNQAYDRYMNETELLQKYYVSTVYNMENVVFAEDLTKKFNFSMDIKLNDTQYKKYSEIVYKTYTENVYERDPESNEIIFETVRSENDLGEVTEIKVPKILHRKGEFILDDSGEKQILHNIGDIVYDAETRKPIIEREDSYYAIIKTVPWFDRIFNVSSKYFDMLKAYKTLLNNQDSISQSLLDGVYLSLGFKKTSGKSSLYKIYNSATESLEPLDNLALSLKFGVAFSASMSKEDKEFSISDIKLKTKEYIYNNTSDVLSISELFRYLKTAVPSIEYCIHYSINNYPSNICQSIHKDTSVNAARDEILCVKMDINESQSDFNNEKFVFDSAIDITIINN